MKVIKVWSEEEKKLGFICFIENTLKMLSNTEAVVQRCSVKNAFIEIWQNSQENSSQLSFLIKLQV